MPVVLEWRELDDFLHAREALYDKQTQRGRALLASQTAPSAPRKRAAEEPQLPLPPKRPPAAASRPAAASHHADAAAGGARCHSAPQPGGMSDLDYKMLSSVGAAIREEHRVHRLPQAAGCALRRKRRLREVCGMERARPRRPPPLQRLCGPGRHPPVAARAR